MTKYTYQINLDSDDEYCYDPTTIFFKDEKIIFRGDLYVNSLFGENNDNELTLLLNYGKYIEYDGNVIKKVCDLFISTPNTSDMQTNSSFYQPMIFTKNKLKLLMNINQELDVDLKLSNIPELTDEDMENVLVKNFINKFGCENYQPLTFNKFKTSIATFSKYDEELNILISNLEIKELIKIKQDEKFEEIIIYLDMDDSFYEWNCLIKYNDNFYLHCVDDYYFGI